MRRLSNIHKREVFSVIARLSGQRKQANAFKLLAFTENSRLNYSILMSVLIGTSLFSSTPAANDKIEKENIRSVLVPSIGKEVKVCMKESALEEHKVVQKLPKFKYIILGFGVAGQAALTTILSKDPWAQVLVIDSSSPNVQQQNPKLNSSRIKFLWQSRASSLDAENTIVTLSDGSSFRFDKCLLATGGARPVVPSNYVSPEAQDKVSNFTPSTDVQALLNIVCKGGHVTVLGGSWNALFLANMLTKAAKKQGFKYGVTLVCPGNGALSNILPKYLSLSLNKRLNTRGLSTLPYTLVRYIDEFQQKVEIDSDDDISIEKTGSKDENTVHESQNENAAASQNEDEVGTVKLKKFKIENVARVYVCRTFDPIETGTFLTDHVVVASLDPYSIPHDSTTAFSKSLEFDSTQKALKVNAELMASSKVYAAGESAHVPIKYGFTSGVHRSIDHAYETGVIAGENMSGSTKLYDSIPMYIGEMDNELGVRMITVGNCHSQLETHGFWWRVSKKGLDGPISKFYTDKFSPLYGLGVVLYLKDGDICGIMLWGFPTYLSSHNIKEDLTWNAIQHAKRIIKSGAHTKFTQSGREKRSRLERVNHLSTLASDVVRETELAEYRPLHRYSAASVKRNDNDNLFQHSKAKTSAQDQWDNHHRARSRGSWFEQMS